MAFSGKAPAGGLGVIRACIMLTAVIAVSLVIVGGIGWWLKGGPGLAAAALGALVCWVSGLSSLALCGVFQGTSWFVHVSMLGMLIRTGLPLLYIMALALKGEALREAGGVWMAMAFYFVTLLFETLILLKQIQLANPGMRR